ncbi:FAD binding domain-containing protein [Actinomadura barringtoniae]|uniref:FAD binding domain-containing protein n=1 Tax=Actinomadura barringtoniae TaxID=1427535 RepID=A0A939T7U4_9ACTN|nr:FAD binding domain-containing protein [Actinomadura barringtoniae]MBO2452394.1 FAD binding domain-containing protein [Actinomadura barringtoniae]
MKPPPFRYHAPRTLHEAVRILAEEENAKVLAGGQSLIPLLNMRLAAPAHLVDINRIEGLDAVEVSGAGVRVGALARHARVERDVGAGELLREAVRHVAHPVIRNRGTVVGSLAHADPAAELPAVLAVLGGWVEAESVRGRRVVAAEELFVGPLESSLEHDEVAVEAFFPALPERAGAAFVETARRHGDYALAGVAAVVELDEDLRVTAARAGYLSVDTRPLVLDLTAPAEEAQAGPGALDWSVAAAYARERVEPEGDIHATADYRRHLVGVLTERALRAATERVLEGAR